MSLILDALRGGRARATPPPNSNAAQTASVLQTLGYGRFSSTSPFNRVKRIVAYVVIGVIVPIVIWGAAVWLSQQYFSGAPKAVTGDVRRPAPAPTPAPRYAPAAVTAPAAPPPVAAAPQPQPAAPSPQIAPAPATATAVAPAPPTPKPVSPEVAAASTPPPPSGRTGGNSGPTAMSGNTPPRGVPSQEAVPSQAQPIVQNSRRPDVPANPPTPPTGTPSGRTSLSISAAGNPGTLVSEGDHFQLALYYQRIGDFENSLVHYRAVLQRDELNAEAHNNLGLLYRDKGLFDEAVKEFGRAIAINQRYVKAHNNLGVAYLGQHRDDAAASEFQTALGIDPRNVESLINLSLAQKESGQRVDARATLARALEIDPRSAEAHYNMALVAEDMGEKAPALTHYRAFLQYATDHPDLVPEVRKRIQLLESKN
jgi:Tfp pilus assembly protein PilF